MKDNRNERTILITCARGVSPYLAQEVRSLGLPVTTESPSGVGTSGTDDDIMRLNLHLRTGHRVLRLMKGFGARNADEMYQAVLNLPWEEHIAADGYFSVHSSVDTPAIRNSQFANQRCKDAIADRIRGRRGRRPDSGPEQTGAVISLYWKDQDCAVYLDASGEPLAKRGYRKFPHRAPMQETLAAAVIMATGWRGDSDFINPMCGGGTLAIEAALIALRRAPGLTRTNFGFMHLRGFDQDRWESLRGEALDESLREPPCRIIASDIDPEALAAAARNANAAGVESCVELAAADFRDSTLPGSGGIIIMNPEYGERLGNRTELESTYRAIGDFFKKRGAGYTGYVFTGNLDLAKKIGLRTKRRLIFFNATIECRLLEYELYEGSRKTAGD